MASITKSRSSTLSHSRSKSRLSQAGSEADDQPYVHPVLEQQLVIRFPPDIANRLEFQMDELEFSDFEIKFTSSHIATVKVLEHELVGYLLNLPTYLESHRTIDEKRLFKSADIGQILICQRPSEPAPPYDPENFMYHHGLSTPANNIYLKRERKRSTAMSTHRDPALSIDGIDYWDIVEIQLASKLSKDKPFRPTIVRQEFFEEPDVDAVMLEKVLRKKVGEVYSGYSDVEISPDQLDDLEPSKDPVIKLPPELLGNPEEEQQVSDELDIDAALDAELFGEEDEHIVEPATQEEQVEEVEEEEYEEEEDVDELANLRQQYDIIDNNLMVLRRQLAENKNEHIKERIENNIRISEQKKESIMRAIKSLESS